MRTQIIKIRFGFLIEYSDPSNIPYSWAYTQAWRPTRKWAEYTASKMEY